MGLGERLEKGGLVAVDDVHFQDEWAVFKCVPLTDSLGAPIGMGASLGERLDLREAERLLDCRVRDRSHAVAIEPPLVHVLAGLEDLDA